MPPRSPMASPASFASLVSGQYPDAQQNHVGSDLFAAAEVYGHTTVFFFKAADTIF